MHPSYYTTVSSLELLVNMGNPYWNIDRTTGSLLQETIQQNKYTRILEIGTSNGLSALYMASAAYHTGGHITTVESHAERFALATKHFEAAGVTHLITQIKGHAPEVLDDIPGMFDMIFIDATSVEYKLYYTHLKSRLATHGTLLADNVISHREKVQDYIDHVMNDPDMTAQIVEIGKGVLIAKKFDE
jgi:predicted O-methyltransferase YrrM